jgi:hypothetical protein
LIYLNLFLISGAGIMNTGFFMTEIIALFSIVGLALFPLAWQQMRTIRINKNT